MSVIQITDLNDPQLDIYARLSEGQLLHYYEPDLGIFIAESPKVIQTAFEQGYEPISFLVEDRHIKTQAKDIILQYQDIPVYTASFDVLKQLTGFGLTRGMLCAMRRKPLPALETICAHAKRIVILENVMNPTNVGAIFRSAAALNMDAILLSKGCSDPLYRRSVRVSMGTVFQIPWTFLGDDTWPADGMHRLKELGYKNVAMALTDRSVSIDDEALMSEDKLAIILGTEGDGLCQETIDACDYTVKIPMAHGVDSLNVAAVLHTSQPSVTRTIHNLEKNLNCRLFERSKVGMKLTPEGEVFYEYIAAGCAQFFKAESNLSDMLSLENGTIYVSATETALHCYLFQAMESFNEQYPNVHFKILNNSTRKSINIVKKAMLILQLYLHHFK